MSAFTPSPNCCWKLGTMEPLCAARFYTYFARLFFLQVFVQAGKTDIFIFCFLMTSNMQRFHASAESIYGMTCMLLCLWQCNHAVSWLAFLPAAIYSFFSCLFLLCLSCWKDLIYEMNPRGGKYGHCLMYEPQTTQEMISLSWYISKERKTQDLIYFLWVLEPKRLKAILYCS